MLLTVEDCLLVRKSKGCMRVAAGLDAPSRDEIDLVFLLVFKTSPRIMPHSPETCDEWASFLSTVSGGSVPHPGLGTGTTIQPLTVVPVVGLGVVA